MSSIDERIVSMRFDNAQFEKGAQASLKTLDKLKRSSMFKGASKGLDELSNTAKRFSLKGLTSGISEAKGHFSALEVAGVTALANITNSAVNTGKQVLRALTVQPVTDGFREYELKVGSMQTIMASTGESVETVNKYIEDLNEYADKTIYSFSDMTQNIGKFTNAGVKLEPAVLAIKGISNAAALAGADANDASHAMYNFAQALGQGSVKLIDWKSIQVAHMDTVDFKKELLKTAVALGTVTKHGKKFISTTTDAKGNISEAFNATTMWNESLAHQWLTTDVLIKTLGRYADEGTKVGAKATEAATKVKTLSQLIDTIREALGTGWGTSFEHIFGNINEAKTLWTGVSDSLGDVINKTSEARNAMLKEWKLSGGRNSIINSFANVYHLIESVVGTAKKGFDEVFPPMTGKRLAEISKSIENVTKNFKFSKEQLSDIQDISKGAFSTIKIFTTGFKDVAGGLLSIIQIFAPSIDGWLAVFGMVGRGLQHISDFILGVHDKIGKFNERLGITQKIGDFLRKGVDKFNKTTRGITAFIKNFGKGVRNLKTDSKAVKFLDDKFRKLSNTVRKLKTHTGKTFEAFKNAFGEIKTGTLQAFGDEFEKIGDAFENKIYPKIQEFFAGKGIKLPDLSVEAWTKPFSEKLDDISEKFSDFVADVTDGAVKLNDKLGTSLTNIKAEDVRNSLNRAFKVMNAAAKNAYKQIDKKGLRKALVDGFNGLGDKIAKEYEKGIGRITKIPMPELKFGNWLDTAIDGLKKFIDWIKTGIGHVVNFVKELTNAKSPLEVVQKILQGIGDTIKKVFDGLKEAGVLDSLKGGLHGITQEIQEFANGMTPAKAAALIFAGFVGILAVSIMTLVNSMNFMINSLGTFFGSAGSLATSLKTLADTFAKQVGPLKDAKTTIKEVAAAIAILVGCLYVIDKLVKGGDIFTDLFVLEVALGSLFGVLVLANKLGAAQVSSQFGTNMLAISGALFIMAKAFQEASKLPDIINESGINANFLLKIGIMLAALGILVGIATVMSRLGKTGLTMESAVNIGVFAISLYGIAKALEIIATIDFSKMGTKDASWGILQTIVLLAGIAKAASMVSWQGGVGMYLTALAVEKLDPILQRLGKKIDYKAVLDTLNNYKAVIVILGGIAVALGSLLGSVKGVHLGNTVKDIGKGLLALGGGIALLVGAVAVLGSLKVSVLTKGVLAVSFLGVVFGGVLSVMALIGKEGGQVKGAGGAMLAMAAAIDMLVAAVYVLGSMDVGMLLKGELAIAGLAAILGGFLKLANGFRTSKNAFMNILAAAGGIVLLAGMLVILSFIKFGDILKGLVGIFGCAVALKAVVDSLKGISKGEALTGIAVLVSVVAAMFAMTFYLTKLAKAPWKNMVAAGAALSAATLSMAAAVKVLSTVKSDWQQALNNIPLIGEVLLAMYGVGLVLKDVAKIQNADKLPEVAVGLAIGIGSLTAVVTAMGALATVTKGVGLLGAAATGFVLDAVMETLLLFVNHVGELTMKMGEANANGDLTKKAENFSKIIVGFIKPIKEAFSSKRKKEVEKTAKDTETFTQKVQSIVTGITDLVKELSKFDTDQAGNIKDIFTGIAELVKPLSVDAFSDKYLGTDRIESLGKFLSGLKDLGPALNDLSGVIGLDTKNQLAPWQIENIKLILPLFTDIANLAAKVPKTGGLASVVFGEADLGKFVKSIASAGQSLSELGGLKIDTSVPDKVELVATSVERMLTAIGDSGLGGGGWSAGVNLAGVFGFDITKNGSTPLSRFVAGIKDSAESLEELKDVEIDNTTTQKVSVVATSVSQIISALTSEGGGLVGMINGQKNQSLIPNGLGMQISSMAHEIASAGASLAKLANVDGIDNLDDSIPEKVGIIADCTQKITEMANKMAGTGGKGGKGKEGGLFGAIKNVFKGFSDRMNINTMLNKVGTIGNQLKLMLMPGGQLDGLTENVDKLDGISQAFAKLQAMSTSVKDIKFDVGSISGLDTFAQTLKTAVPKLADVSKSAGKISLANIYRVKNAVTILKDTADGCGEGKELVKFGNNLKKLAKALSDFSSKTAGIDVGQIAQQLSQLGSISADASGFQQFAENVKTAMDAALKAIVPDDFAKAGKACATKLAKGISDNKKSVVDAGRNASKAGADAARANSAIWVSAGIACAHGLANGIILASYVAVQAGIYMAQQTVNAVKAVFNSHSPSKVFQKIGEDDVEGFAIGLTDSKSKSNIRKSVGTFGTYALKVTNKKTNEVTKSATKKSSKSGKKAVKKSFSQVFGKSFVNAFKKYAKAHKKAFSKGMVNTITNAKKKIITSGAALKKAYAKALNTASVATKAKYNPFNANALVKTKNGLEATATYLAASVKNGKISNALSQTKSTLVKRINDLFKAGVKSGKWGKNSKSGMKQVTQRVIKEANESYANLQTNIASLPKNYRNAITKIPSAVAAYMANNKNISRYASGSISAYNKQFGDQMKIYSTTNKVVQQYDKKYNALTKRRDQINKKLNNKKTKKKDKTKLQAELKTINAQIKELNKVKSKVDKLRSDSKKYSSGKAVLNTFAEALYMNSSQYTTDKKALTKDTKTLIKQQNQLKSLQKERKKHGKDSKEYKKLTKKINSLNKKIKSSKKSIKNDLAAMAKGAEKAFKEFRNSIKTTIADMGKLSNVKLAEALFSGFNWEAAEAKFDAFGAAVSKTLNSVSSSTGTTTHNAISAVTEAFDVLSNSFSTGINYFEKFTKTGTAEPDALMEYIDTQLGAFDEWFTGIETLEKRGLDASIIKELESQGVTSINYVRGYLAMTDAQIAQYNKKVQRNTENSRKMLMRTSEQQSTEYSKWMSNVTKLAQRTSDGVAIISAEFVDKIKSSGVGSADLVELLVGMSDEALKIFNERYAYSISGDVLDFTDAKNAASEAGKAAAEQTTTSFIEALRSSKSENAAWEEKLETLKSMGFSKDVVNYFKEMGRESGEQWVDSIIDTYANSSELIAKNARIDAIDAEIESLNKQGKNSWNSAEVKALKAERVNLVREVRAFKAENRELITEINSAMADSISNQWDEAVKNMKAENDAWDEYKRNKQRVAETASTLGGDTKKKYLEVANSLKELGYSEAEGMKLMASASIRQVLDMWNELDRRKEANQENQTETLFGDFSKIKTQQKEYADALNWVSENVFVQGSVTISKNAKRNQEELQKSQQALMDQLMSMGPEEAIAYVNAIRHGSETEHAAFVKWQENFWQSNIKLPGTYADSIAASYASVYTGASTQAANSINSSVKQIQTAIENAAKKANNNAKKSVNNSAVTMTKSATSAATKQAKSGGQDTGKAVCTGVAKGIKNNTKTATNAATQLGKDVIAAAKKAVKSNSPSKVFMEIGGYLDEGLAIGLKNNADMPVEAVGDVADAVTNYAALAYGMITQMADAEDINFAPTVTVDDSDIVQVSSLQDELFKLLALASEEINTNPVITPVLDLDEVRKQAQETDKLFGDTQANVAAALNPEIQNGANSGVTFVQNNYSPKALDALEIYRQTRNQFASVRGVVYA